MYTDLVALAKEPTGENRRAVMQQISDLFVEGAEDYNNREIVLFGDIFCQLLDMVRLEDRIALSERVAPLPQTASRLINRLARDENAAVAGPVLTHSSVLTEADLRDIARSEGQGHLLAIAQRTTLPETVTDVLIDRGDNSVLDGVSSNQGARFSDTGLQQLTVKAIDYPQIVGNLIDHADVPFERLDRIVASLDPVSGERLQAFVDHHREAAAALLRETQERMLALREQRDREEQETRFLAAMIREGKHRLDTAIEELVAAKRLVDIATLLAELDDLNEIHVSNVLHKVNDFGIALVCRSSEVGESAYHALSVLRCERLGLPAEEAERMTREYMLIDRASAERALRFHRVRTSVMGR